MLQKKLWEHFIPSLVLLFMQKYYARYKIKLRGKLQKKDGGRSIQNSLIMATKILELQNYRGEFLNEIISFSCKDVTKAIKTMG